MEVEGARRGRVGMKVDGDSLQEYISCVNSHAQLNRYFTYGDIYV